MQDDAFPTNAVNGARVVELLIALIRRFIVVSDAGAIVAAVWVLHTHAFGVSEHTPYLFIRSAARRCGKSRFLDLLRLLVPRPILTTDITVAALFRTIDARRPTVLFDEMDRFTRARDDNAEMQRILNAGFQRGRPVMRCAGEGTNQMVVEFDVFCPKAIAAIGNLADTVVDRSLTIELKRRAQHEQVERFHQTEVEPLAKPLRDQAAKWAEANLPALRTVKPQLPDELDDRGQDVAEPLCAIADCLGGKWPETVRNAIVQLRRSGDEDDGDVGVRLLAAIKDAFDAANTDWLSTTELVHWLTKDDSSPWKEWRRGTAISPVAIANRLRPFNIHPEQHKRGGDRARGYRREQFDDAFARYLTPKTEAEPRPAPRVVADTASASPNTEPGRKPMRPSPFLRPTTGGDEAHVPNPDQDDTDPLREV
jgi:hypothetical protein